MAKLAPAPLLVALMDGTKVDIRSRVDCLPLWVSSSAEITAMATIGAADGFGLPVSTTHVLSSGVAGTMAANHSGIQLSTVRNLALAWVLTLPVAMLLSGSLFALFKRIF